jgi:uncharacterized protein
LLNRAIALSVALRLYCEEEPILPTAMKLMVTAIRTVVAPNEIAEFCQHWKVAELAVFGSVLRDDFDPDSDIDFLVDFAAGATWGLLDHIQMQQELEGLLGRKVDLISKRALQGSPNWIRRQSILNSAEVIYTATDFQYTA